MNLLWNERHGAIFTELTTEFKELNIRYFVLRNYKGLPEKNESQDIDIIIEPGQMKKARQLLLEVYRKHGLEYHVETIFGRVHCMLGMDTKEMFSIHIDLIEGYISKGYEIFTFDELYEHTVWYRGFRVMDDFFDAIMIYIYKQFGYQHPRLKKEYQTVILEMYQQKPTEFQNLLTELTGKNFAAKVCSKIGENDFDGLLCLTPVLTKRLRRYVWKKKPFSTFKNVISFLVQKCNRIIFSYKKYAKTFAVMAPDGAGKTTFLDVLLKKMYFYYVNRPEDNRFSVYHFRPSVLPNLGAVGERAGVMKQDTDFTNPHRSKPANPLSSLVRISYYTMDYIIGWQKCVRKDVQFDRYTVFDRYSYDFIVDPLRTKLNLPKCIRRFFVALTPQPEIVFYLDANPNIIYARKQELSLDEIKRQVGEYRELVQKNPQRFVTINAEQTPEKMAQEAIIYLLNRYAEKFDTI